MQGGSCTDWPHECIRRFVDRVQAYTQISSSTLRLEATHRPNRSPRANSPFKVSLTLNVISPVNTSSKHLGPEATDTVNRHKKRVIRQRITAETHIHERSRAKALTKPYRRL